MIQVRDFWYLKNNPNQITVKELFEVTVKDNHSIAPGAFILSFRRDFRFQAGQVIGITNSRDIEPRLYSIASAPDNQNIDILYTEVKQGILTPKLSKLKPGDTILITNVFGKFTSDKNAAVFIASGTGIAPFASMLRSGNSNQKILIQGSRSKEHLYFYEELKNILGENYFVCTSREEWDESYHGRVTGFLKRFGVHSTQTPYYLCGSAEMVVDTRDILLEAGVAFQNIRAEIFF